MNIYAFIILNIITFFVYGLDKLKAVKISIGIDYNVSGVTTKNNEYEAGLDLYIYNI